MSRGGLVIDPKRKRVRSPEINSTNKKTVNVLTNYWLRSTVKLTNRFEKLGEVVENDQSTCEAAESDGQQKEDPVMFPLSSGDQCENCLHCLTELGIGIRCNSIISVISTQCSFWKHTEDKISRKSVPNKK
uniref:Uncharacterized protein n=1 Tax=Trichogramma kaykai TaxID=54128 RepID=A0ABD2WAI1_9HYME